MTLAYGSDGGSVALYGVPMIFLHGTHCLSTLSTHFRIHGIQNTGRRAITVKLSPP